MSNDIPEGRFTAEHIDIELDPSTRPINASSKGAQKVKMYNMPSLAEKIKLCLIVLLAGVSLLSNLCSFASSLGLFSSTNTTLPCSQWRPPMP